MNTGVYGIFHIPTQRVYIGSVAAKSGFTRRFYIHRKDLTEGKHHSRYLQRAWNKYGSLQFEFRVLYPCSPEDCIMVEQIHIDLYESANPSKGFNMCPKAGNCLGLKHTKETRQKVSLAGMGRKNSPESIEKTRVKIKGLKRSPEQRARIAAGARNRYKNMTQEERKRYTDCMRTPEVRAKHSEFMKGNSYAAEASALRRAAKTVEELEHGPIPY